MQSSDLESLLASRDPEERRQATASLFGRASDSPAGAARLVLRALGDDDWRVRKEAVAAALALSPSRELLDQLVSALGAGDNVGLRNAAVEAIAGYGQEAVEALLQALPSLDADGRKLAAEALGRTGRDSAVPVLVPLLRDEDPNVRIAAVEALATVGRAGIGEVVPLLESCLYSDEPLLVLAALDGLNALGAVLPFGTVSRFFESALLKRSALVAAGRTRDPRVVAPLLECLETATGRGFLDLVFSLCELARGRRAGDELRRAGALLSTKTSARLAALVNDEYTHEELRRAALVVVAALGLDGAVALALGALSDERFLAEAHEAIELLGDTALAALVRAVSEGDEAERASCLAVLARVATEGTREDVAAAALAALSDPSPEVERQAFAVLARFGDESALVHVGELLCQLEEAASVRKAAERAFEKLCQRFEGPARELARQADPARPEAYAACIVLRALGAGVRGGSDDVAFLSAALKNTSSVVRSAALDALAELGGDAAAEAIALALTDEEHAVRVEAITALGRVRDATGRPLGLPSLIALVEHERDTELLAEAVHALGETQDPSVIAVLGAIAKRETPMLAVSAVEALSRIGGEAATDRLLDALAHGETEVVKAALLAIAETSDPRVLGKLTASLEHEAWDVRGLAADLLARFAGEGARGALRSRLLQEDNPLVREAIAHALERLSGVRRTPLPVLGGGGGPAQR
ncbi:MAG TPA: HEAT repeat domain-containing protein [Polyangiaceae bacterium]|nr:HEAT repeat domain-containing protein [Polyangiaceae bacterium]